jgi:hypothetical protein
MPFNNDYKLHDINNTIHVHEIYETRHSINSQTLSALLVITFPSTTVSILEEVITMRMSYYNSISGHDL